MTEHTEQAPLQPSAVPARVDLEDFIEVVARALRQAWAAPDDVRGYADDVSGHASMIGGLWFAPPAEEGNPAVPPTRVGVDGPSFDPPRLPRQPRDV
ncbi:MAG: hypothetical protein ACRDJE_11175 [Dehalococcoidia bacterium]